MLYRSKNRGYLSHLAVGLLVALAVMAPRTRNQAYASSFALREGSTDWMANAFAGDTAKAYDASTAWSNPAGMVLLQQNEIDGAINGIFGATHFSGGNFVGGAPTLGSTSSNAYEPNATGGAYGVWSVTPDFKLGFGLATPFGDRVAYPTNFVGRYQSLVSALTSEQFAIAAAFRINDQLSIGGGPVINFFDARFTQAINTGPTSALTGDPIADVHGSDVSVGFNVGLLYQLTPALRFGIDYRSRLQNDINAMQTVSVPTAISLLAPFTAAQLRFLNTPVTSKLTLPDSVTIGGYWQATPQLALLSDVSWTDWSLFKDLTITPTMPGVPGSTTVENWHNTVALSVGANYRLTQDWLLQSGVGFDQSPVPQDTRNTRIPDSDRYLIGLGAQYQILPNLTLQVAYAHVFFANAELTSSSTTSAGVIVGKYSSSADTASLGVKWRF